MTQSIFHLRVARLSTLSTPQTQRLRPWPIIIVSTGLTTSPSTVPTARFRPQSVSRGRAAWDATEDSTNLQSLFAEDGEITHAGISRTSWAMIPAAPISCSDRQEMDERSGPSPAGLCLKLVKARQKVWVSSTTAAVQGIWKSALAFAVHPEPGAVRSSKVSENDRSIQQLPTQQQRRGFPSTCE